MEQPLPLPERLEPDATTNSLMMSVRIYFFQLYNKSAEFRSFLASLNNKQALTGNLLFDRYKAVAALQETAASAGDMTVARAKEGEVYKCICRIMKKKGQGLNLRREKYRELMQQAAE